MDANPDQNENPGCLGRILALLGIGPKSVPTEDLPYRLRDDFLSPAEHSFYLVLKGMMRDYLTVCPKVNLADIFFVAQPQKNYAARARIDRRHVDFLVCDPKTMRPQFGIELDDASHRRKNQIERDRFVGAVFARANLPLVRVPVAVSYDQRQLGDLFRSAMSDKVLSAQTADGSGESPQIESEIPNCPKCGVPMVLREAKRGSRRGERFYGCANYPRCKEIIPIVGTRS
jgi:hypothetical protein